MVSMAGELALAIGWLVRIDIRGDGKKDSSRGYPPITARHTGSVKLRCDLGSGWSDGAAANLPLTKIKRPFIFY
jgi:hypothetical protein